MSVSFCVLRSPRLGTEKLLSYMGESSASNVISIHYDNKGKLLGKEHAYKELVKRKRGGLRMNRRWIEGKEQTSKSHHFPMTISPLQCEPAEKGGQADGRSTVLQTEEIQDAACVSSLVASLSCLHPAASSFTPARFKRLQKVSLSHSPQDPLPLAHQDQAG